MNELPLFGIGKNGQTFFRLDEPDGHRNDRLFFAILVENPISAALARRAADWRRELGLRGKPFRAQRLHISLIGLGDHDGLPDGWVEIACRIGSIIEAKPFEVCFDRLVGFWRWRVGTAGE